MARGENLHVVGRVSPSLIANFGDFQRLWAERVPDRFRIVQISADEETETAPRAGGGR